MGRIPTRRGFPWAITSAAAERAERGFRAFWAPFRRKRRQIVWSTVRRKKAEMRTLADQITRAASKRPPGPGDLFGLKSVQQFRAAPLAFLTELHREYGDIVY